jgi:DNA replication protein DnaC
MTDEFTLLKDAEARARVRYAEANPPETAPVQIWVAKVEPISAEGKRILEERAIAQHAHEMAKRSDRRNLRLQRATACIPARYSGARLWGPELCVRVRSQSAIEATQRSVSESVIVWTGLSGSGKSTLACAALRDRAAFEVSDDRRPRFAFVRASELGSASKHQKLGDGVPELVRECIAADLLVIDELGSEPRSPHWTDVEDVVFARYERDLATWYTTWTTAEDIAKRYGDGFARRVFERIVIDCGAR